MEAEAAFVAHDEGVAGQALSVLEPYRGELALAGAVLLLGPVDGYVALCRSVLGDAAGASEAADAAEMLAAEWDMPAYLTWLRRHREQAGF